jgi:hypothetical protein
MISLRQQFRQFVEFMAICRGGGTILMMGRDFVAMDHRTWEKIQSWLHPQAPIVHYDEYAQASPDDVAKIEDWVQKVRPSHKERAS